jgi:hypothetical protein
MCAGNPLSLLLFVIVMDAFSRMIAIAIDCGFMLDFLVGTSLSNRVNISHFLFADDTLFFRGVNLSLH